MRAVTPLPAAEEAADNERKPSSTQPLSALSVTNTTEDDNRLKDVLSLRYTVFSALVSILIASGVTRLSSSKSIKQAYRRIALSSHPDKVSHEQREEATKRFQDIQVAYDVLYDPSKRHAYDRGQLRQDGIHTPPPETDHDGARPWYSTRTEMPPTPESTRSGHWWDRPNSHHSSFTSFDEGVRYDGRPKVMTFLEATLRFHPEDRRHLWLCSDEDDPAVYGENHIVKRLHVSLQE